MKAAALWVAGILLAAVLLVSVATVKDGPGAAVSSLQRPELAYLQAVNRAGPPQDPQLLFLLMGQYANANLHREGAEFFSALLKEFEPRLSDAQKSLYLAAIGVLRAGHADEVALLSRVGWVKDTVAMLEDAKRLSGGEIFVVRWMAGVVSARLPGFFGRKEAALEDLTWCLQNIDKAPHPGWLREVYRQLASLERRSDPAKAQEYLRLTGYAGFDEPLTLTTPFAEDPAQGNIFSAKRIAEVIPGKVFVLSGFEFTEYYFVVSDDGRQLIGIDAGVRPDSAKEAYEALRAYAPALPELTTIFVTHAHWDHVGGHRYFRSLNPRPKFYARTNYHEELARSVAAPAPFFKRFFGERFSMEDVRSFKPDAILDRHTELKVGGTRFELIPVEGGETNDALFIHLPDHGVMFVGDFVMPYFGAPFVEEGNLDGMLDAIDIVAKKNPRHLLHGHEPLTRVFDSPAVLTSLKPHLIWLRAQVAAAIQRGAERAAIHQANLISPGLLAGEPGAHLPYLLMRENLINRIYDQSVGYWQPDLQGVDHLGRADRGSVLVDYLGVSERQLAKAVERMIADGKYELAAATLDWTKGRFPEGGTLGGSERLAYLKLMEKYQEFNPFKFIIYSVKSGMNVPQMSAPRGH
jgi:glyoxylase-like metal-dependent hydrolase (beta-lactamase superfamily II)